MTTKTLLHGVNPTSTSSAPRCDPTNPTLSTRALDRTVNTASRTSISSATPRTQTAQTARLSHPLHPPRPTSHARAHDKANHEVTPKAPADARPTTQNRGAIHTKYSHSQPSHYTTSNQKVEGNMHMRVVRRHHVARALVHIQKTAPTRRAAS